MGGEKGHLLRCLLETKTLLQSRPSPAGWLTASQTPPLGKVASGAHEMWVAKSPSCPAQFLTNSFPGPCEFSAEPGCCCWMALTGTSATAVNSLLVTGPRPLRATSVAFTARPARHNAQTSSVASAPMHAPYWRRRGLSVQIISPLPSRAPISPWADHISGARAPPAICPSFPPICGDHRGANRRQKSQPQHARLLKFKARDSM